MFSAHVKRSAGPAVQVTAKPKSKESEEEQEGHVYLTWPASLSFVSASLRLHFPPGRSEQAAASNSNGCVTLRARAPDSGEEASRRCRRCKVSVSFVSPSQSLSIYHDLKFGLFFFCAFFIHLFFLL